MNRVLDWIEDERWLESVIGGQLTDSPDPVSRTPHVIETIYDDSDPCGLIVDDGAPI